MIDAATLTPGTDVMGTDTPFVVGIVLRGQAEHILWSPGGIEGSEPVVSRLLRHDFDASDPVAVLAAVRSVFGQPAYVAFDPSELRRSA